MKLVFSLFLLYSVFCPAVRALQVVMPKQQIEINNIIQLNQVIEENKIQVGPGLIVAVDFDTTLAKSILYVDGKPFYTYYPLRTVSRLDWNESYESLLFKIGFPEENREYYNYSNYVNSWIPQIRNNVNLKGLGRSRVFYSTVEVDTAMVMQSLLSKKVFMPIITRGVVDNVRTKFLEEYIFTDEAEEIYFVSSKNKAAEIIAIMNQRGLNDLIFLDDSSAEIQSVMQALSKYSVGTNLGTDLLAEGTIRVFPVHYNYFHHLVTYEDNREIIAQEMRELIKTLNTPN